MEKSSVRVRSGGTGSPGRLDVLQNGVCGCGGVGKQAWDRSLHGRKQVHRI